MAVVDAVHNTDQIVACGIVAPFFELEYDVQAIALNNQAFCLRDKSQTPSNDRNVKHVHRKCTWSYQYV